MSRELVTIDVDAPVGVDVEELTRGPVDVDGATEFLQELELPSLLDRIIPPGSEGAGAYELVTTKKALGFAHQEALVAREGSSSTSRRRRSTRCAPRSSALRWLTRRTARTTCRSGTRAVTGWPRDHVLQKLKPLLEDESVPKIGQNQKYDYEVLLRYGIEMSPLSFDTMIASYLLEPEPPAARALGARPRAP